MSLPTMVTGHAPLRGALWMIGAGACFAVGNSLLRYLTGVLPSYEVAFLQYGLALLILLPWALVRGLASIRTGRPWFQALRVAAAATGVVFITLGFQKLPVVEVVALTFASPLFAVVGAALVLKERVGWQRWAATALGFVGVLVILRPGLEAFRPAGIYPLAAAFFFAVSSLMVKRLAVTETPDSIVFYLLVLMTPMLLVPAIPVWQAPTVDLLPFLLALGLSAAAAQFALTHAFASADASFLGPFDFARLPFSALVAYFAFGETPDRYAWIGAGLILSAALYLAQQESR